MITRMDRDVGRIVDLLRTRGLAEMTLVSLPATTDRTRRVAATPISSAVLADCAGSERDMYEGGIRVPMVASWPGVIPAGSNQRLCRGPLGLVPDVR